MNYAAKRKRCLAAGPDLTIILIDLDDCSGAIPQNCGGKLLAQRDCVLLVVRSDVMSATQIHSWDPAASGDDGCKTALTADELQTLLDSAKRVRPQAESRQSNRTAFRVSVRATIQPHPDSPSDTARVCHLLTQDLSHSGVSIVHARPFATGQRIELEFPDGCRSVVVCRTTALSDGFYLAGCRFEDD